MRYAPKPLAPCLAVACAIAWFAATAGRRIALPGLDYDEVLFVNAAVGGESNSFVVQRLFGFPVMLMDYIGALKAYVFAPIFALFGVSAATIRWPAVLVSCVSIVLVYALGRLTIGTFGGAVAAVLVALDPVFVYLTKLDFGPIVLMMVLKLLALYCFYRAIATRSVRLMWVVTICCMLGVFDKLNFIWFVIALVIAAVTLFPRELARMYRRRGASFVAPVAVLAAAMGAAALVLIGPQYRASQRDLGDVGILARLPQLVARYSRTMDGRELYSWVTDATLGTRTIVNWLTVVAVLVLLALWLGRAWRRRSRGEAAPHRLTLRERFVAGYLVLFVLIALQIVVTRRAGGPHHMMMLYPFHLLLVVGAAAAAAKSRGPSPSPWRGIVRVVAGLALVALAASELLVAHGYADAFESETRVRPRWSPVIYELAAYLRQQDADRIAFVDWGMHNQVYALGDARTRSAARDLWIYFRGAGTPANEADLIANVFQNRRVLVVLHPRGAELVPDAQDSFLAWSRTRGLSLRPVRTFADSAGRVIYEVAEISPVRTIIPVASPARRSPAPRR